MNHADVVVRKHLMSPRQIDFRHVTTDAIRSRHRAGLHCPGIRMARSHACTQFRARTVAGEALCVVAGIIVHDFLVWIVASNTAHPCILAVKTLADGQPVRRKAYIHLPYPVVPNDRFPGSVALTAKCRYVFRRKLFQAWRNGSGLRLRHCLHVAIRACVTTDACDTWGE